MKRSSRRRPRRSRSSDSINSARGYALRLLAVRGRSERELRDRLRRKGFAEGTVEETVSSLKDAGLVDDLALRDDLISYALNVRSLGVMGTRMLLLKRGIPEEVVDSADLEGLDETEGAERLVRKRVPLLKGLPEAKARRRLWGMLRRRGYSCETIARVMRGLLPEDR